MVHIRAGSWKFLLLIQTHANQERTAEAALTAPYRGCSVYFPKILTRRSHARRVEHVERPFIQRYGFVERGEWRVVRTAPGVSHIVASGDAVRRAVDEIRAREYAVAKANGELVRYVDLDDEPAPFSMGDAVNVTTLAARGIFCRMRDGLRAEILLGMIRTTVPLSCLEAA